MAQKYYNVAEAAKILGVSPADINQMVLRRELYGYSDGADWKFKPEDIERVAAERGAGGHDEAGDNVLASEIELGQSDPGLSGTVIGADKNRSSAESDIHLAESDVKLAQGKTGASDLNLLESGIDLAGPKQPAEAKRGDAGSKVSQFEDLDMTLDHDLTLEDSNVAVSPAQARRGERGGRFGRRSQRQEARRRRPRARRQRHGQRYFHRRRQRHFARRSGRQRPLAGSSLEPELGRRVAGTGRR